MRTKKDQGKGKDKAVEQGKTTQAHADASTTANAGTAEGANAANTVIHAGSLITINATTVSASIEAAQGASVRRSTRTVQPASRPAAQQAILPPSSDDDTPSDVDDSYSDIIVDEDIDMEARMQEIRAILVKEQAALEDLQKRQVIATTDMYKLRQSKVPMTDDEKSDPRPVIGKKGRPAPEA
jgi:hypothetical protein